MRRISHIGSLLKKIYRVYSYDLLDKLSNDGFTDLRPSFLEIMSYLCEFEGASIKDIGRHCGLKKQTMTSHLNELEKRGYIQRQTSDRDKREQRVFLTTMGENFKSNLLTCLSLLEREYTAKLGEEELSQVQGVLEGFFTQLSSVEKLSREIEV